MPQGGQASSQHGKGDSVAETGDEPLDPAVIASLFVEHGAALEQFLVGLLRDPHQAADALQATFTKLVEKGHETRPGTRKGWLFRVAYHEAMFVRRRGAVGDKVVRNVAWSLPAATAAGDDPLVRLEAVEGVRRALVKLPADLRQIVRMRIFEEKTFAVIAEELQIPLGTALGRMRTALIKLRHMLGETYTRGDAKD